MRGLRQKDRSNYGNDESSEESDNEMSFSQTSEVLFHRTIDAIYKSNWKTCTNLIAADPSIITMSLDQYNRMNILHIVASHDGEIPRDTVVKIVSKKPEAMGMTDEDGNLPLHLAAGNTFRTVMVKLLMKGFHGGVAAKNVRGDTPLHIAARLGTFGDVIVRSIITVFPRGITCANNLGQLPIHSACQSNSISLDSVRLILENHYTFHTNSCKIDDKGNSPIHLAIKASANVGIITAFHDADQSFFECFLRPDSKGNLPLHTAFAAELSPDFVAMLVKASPAAGRISDGNGIMPIVTATLNDYPVDLIKRLLEVDMPFDVSQKLDIIVREHGHSWWHVLVNCDDRYLQLVNEILSKASLRQVIALSQCVGPDGVRANNKMSKECGEVFKHYLRKFGKYEISDVLNTKCREVITYSACEFGSGTFAVDGKIFQTVGGTVEDSCTSSVIIEKRKVSLRLYAFKEDFHREINVRNTYKINNKFVEEMISMHERDMSKNVLESGNMFGIAYQCPEHTLANVFQCSHMIARGTKWMNRCRDVLGHVGTGIRYIHQRGIVHGELTPDNIGKYGDTWKIMSIGFSAPFGHAMRGHPHQAIPPESVSCATNFKGIEKDVKGPLKPSGILKSSLNGVERVKFHDTIDDGSRDSFSDIQKVNTDSLSNDYLSIDEMINGKELVIKKLQKMIEDGSRKFAHAYVGSAYTCTYTPERCLAGPTWDIWAFGLLMVQLLVGESSMIPNSTTSVERLLLKMYAFDEYSLEIIKNQVSLVDGEMAANLIGGLLHPSPEERLSTVGKVLKHKYFHKTEEKEASSLGPENNITAEISKDDESTLVTPQTHINEAPVGIVSAIDEEVLREDDQTFGHDKIHDEISDLKKNRTGLKETSKMSKRKNKNKPLIPFRLAHQKLGRNLSPTNIPSLRKARSSGVREFLPLPNSSDLVRSSTALSSRSASALRSLFESPAKVE